MASRLKAARMAFEPNGAEVARLLGVTPQVLNAYEKARNFPDEYFLVQFCELTRCPMDWIFRGKMSSEMSAEMASRIGHFAPELVEGLAADRQVAALAQEAVVA